MTRMNEDDTSAAEMARIWKAEFERKASIGTGSSAGHAFDQWKYWEKRAART